MLQTFYVKFVFIMIHQEKNAISVDKMLVKQDPTTGVILDCGYIEMMTMRLHWFHYFISSTYLIRRNFQDACIKIALILNKGSLLAIKNIMNMIYYFDAHRN